ncbi:D-glycerate dehydrogenase [Halorubrum sp. CBA1125]|uniref:2-hydroxyacid dehydrogenase n=1 Tax=Halorubrum sp. CBA1125 TaxID=2668072 RepID=UPI0012E978BB|nr:D-glycerate dehydrogenase [Halorubrum sp. CBA1125]MUW13802.1 D-glycerate dehydrogenase [Halorubrum sp. CBA1125]
MHDTPRVYVTRQIPQAGMERLEEECDVFVWDEPTAPPRDRLVERVADLRVDGLFCNVADTVDEAVIDASPDLRSIATMSVGYDHIDLDAAAERDVAVGHTPGVLSETTADLGWALLMAAARRVVEADQQVHDGEWTAWGPTILLGRDVHDATLGVVGLGRIGTAFARRAAGFDMDVLYTHTSRNEAAEAELASYGIDAEHCTLTELLERVDFLSLQVPLLEETEGLIGEEELRLMDDEAVLVNTARGEVVDTDALDAALENDWIRHAALDVTDPEPLPPTHSLLRHAPEKLTVTPHIGSASIETRSEMAVMTATNLLAGLRDERPPHSALADAGYE